ncbi:hypothetical protein [Longimicrobium terrae]|uniref:Uncharacterized protein n=1 Tax=Longimicrobium terrae TaxID=1639882 RepID=A0A841H1J2_9BACT|nr:hypothetical protein [Longimicrobium terrae]MBB4637440.1 hypothetical protein [Longimicrobium terrae]MBB6071838.1 hypothetical protein [Longimicrobium terrae]NNC30387.1 hypothetical protein [Longimicrobium terrae]
MSRVLVTVRRTACALLAAFVMAPGAAAQGASASRPPMGLLTAMSAAEQTRLALSTAPPEVSAHASVFVLADGRYTQTRTGTNGFTCLIERELLETVEPVCYDAEGSATTMLARFHREELRAQGLPEDEVKRRIDAAYAAGRLLAPRKPGLVYMLAAEQWSYNPFEQKVWNAPAHFMLYAPYAKQEDMGAAAGPGMPVIAWPGQPDALIIVMAHTPATH